MHLSCDILTANNNSTANHSKGGEHMTDSEKLDLILSEMQGMKADMQNMKADMQNMKVDMQNMNSRIDNVESQIKQTERVLKNEIRKECELVLDEIERVHTILDSHKADKSAHSA
mgnify:CR=1 FL=1